MDIDDNLYQRSEGGFWYVRDQRAGQDFKKSLRTRDKGEARKRAKLILDQRDYALYHGRERPAWQQATESWAEEYLPDAVKPKTADRYIVSIGQLESFFGDKLIDQITTSDIVSMIRQRRRAGTDNRTIQNDLTALGSVMTFAVANEWRDDNPVKAVDRALVRKRRKPIVLPTEEDFQKLLAKCPPMVARMILMLRYTGMRQEELVSLQRRQVNLERGEILLTNTKRDRPRVLSLCDPVLREAAGTLSGTPAAINCPYVFWHPDRDGRPDRYRNFSSRFIVIRTAAKVGFRCHDLRHLFAVDYLNETRDLYRLKEIMGHSSIKQTEEYCDYIEGGEQLKQAKIRTM